MWNYLKENWKQVIHLLLGTYRFGVNNERQSDFPSMFGIPIYYRTPRRIWRNYKAAKFRAINCYFVTSETARKLFPFHFWRKRNG